VSRYSGYEVSGEQAPGRHLAVPVDVIEHDLVASAARCASSPAPSPTWHTATPPARGSMTIGVAAVAAMASIVDPVAVR